MADRSRRDLAVLGKRTVWISTYSLTSRPFRRLVPSSTDPLTDTAKSAAQYTWRFAFAWRRHGPSANDTWLTDNSSQGSSFAAAKPSKASAIGLRRISSDVGDRTTSLMTIRGRFARRLGLVGGLSCPSGKCGMNRRREDLQKQVNKPKRTWCARDSPSSLLPIVPSSLWAGWPEAL